MSTTADELRRKIFESLDIASELVEVPEWGVTIKFRSPTVKTRAELLRLWMVADTPDPLVLFPALLMATAVDPETDEPLFREEDREMLLTKSGAVVDRLVAEALKVSGMDGEAVNRGKVDSTGTTNAST